MFQLKPTGSGKKVFVINKGEALFSIADRLEREGIIRNKWFFLAYLKLIGKGSRIQAGSFLINGSDSIAQLVKELQKGRSDLKVTLIEGWRKEEIALELKKKLGISTADFLVLAKGKEGYLFPDTYLFPQEITADKLVSVMVDNFDSKWLEVENESLIRGLTKSQVAIIASLVEREVKGDREREVVAGILVKRWRANWPLQVDATVQYAKASLSCKPNQQCDWWPVISKRDLDLDSPYNTYKRSSLPPTPICNPSLSSLKAVANSSETEYWFYLSDREGKIHFARSLEEHDENVKKYLR